MMAQMMFESSPVNAPTHGPATAPTKTVPIESRYSGNLRAFTIWPTAMLMAIAIGIMANDIVLKSRFKRSISLSNLLFRTGDYLPTPNITIP